MLKTRAKTKQTLPKNIRLFQQFKVWTPLGLITFFYSKYFLLNYTIAKNKGL